VTGPASPRERPSKETEETPQKKGTEKAGKSKTFGEKGAHKRKIQTRGEWHFNCLAFPKVSPSKNEVANKGEGTGGNGDGGIKERQLTQSKQRKKR